MTPLPMFIHQMPHIDYLPMTSVEVIFICGIYLNFFLHIAITILHER